MHHHGLQRNDKRGGKRQNNNSRRTNYTLQFKAKEVSTVTKCMCKCVFLHWLLISMGGDGL